MLPNPGHCLSFAFPCRAGRWVVQLGRFRVPPVGATAASAVTHSFPRRYKMKLGWVLPASLLSVRLWIALVKTDRRRNSHVAVERANGCVWSISMLPTSGMKHWFVSQSQVESLQQRRLLHVCEVGNGDAFANVLIIREWLYGVGFFPLSIKGVSLLTGKFYVRGTGKKLHNSLNCVLIRC